jgi:hypothetical protein
LPANRISGDPTANGDILARVRNAYPQIETRIIRANSTELYHKVLNGDLDGSRAGAEGKFILVARRSGAARDAPQG